MSHRRAVVLVLGDLGRSPRMQRHALMLASSGFDVHLLGLGDTPLPSNVAKAAHVRLLRRSPLSAAVRLAFLLLFSVRRADVILVQTPPALPLLPVVLFLAPLLRARVIVDWHNFTTDMLQLRSDSRFLMRLAANAERRARRASAHLAVSNALASELRRRHGIESTVLHDRPTRAFVPAIAKRPLVISPTSWSLDEDFDLLIDAARFLEDRQKKIRILVTGRGERRAQFERKFDALGLRHVQLKTDWVPPDDYPALLASADLGLCLHRSASGVDLPIKLAEMRGCDVPALVLDYGAVLREIVQEGESAIFFRTAYELASLLADPPPFAPMRPPPRWEEEWTRVVPPLLQA